MYIMQNISGCAVIKSDLYVPVVALLGMSKGCYSSTKKTILILPTQPVFRVL